MTYTDEYRTIYARLVDDPEFQALGDQAQRLWFFLRTSPECAITGLFRFYPELYIARMRMKQREVEFTAAIRELEEGKWVGIEAGWMLIRNAMRFNAHFRPHRDTKHLRRVHTDLTPLSWLTLAWDLLAMEGLPIPEAWKSKGHRRPSGGPFKGLTRVLQGSTKTLGPPSPSPSTCFGSSTGIRTGSKDLFPEPTAENVREVIDRFNSILGGKLASVTELSDARVKATKVRLTETKHGPRDLADYFRLVLKCPFLLGKNDAGWRATFDWLLKPSNMAKVKDGNYKRAGGPPPSTRDYTGASRKVEVGDGDKDV